MAAIGAATGSAELVTYAEHNKGGVLNMCTALENLRNEGLQDGENRMAKLTKLLIDEGHISKLERAAVDLDYRNMLFEEYDL